MAYTTIKKPSDYFNTKLYSGTGSSNSITGVGFQPDFTWIKRRNSATNHHLHNAISGATKVLYSNSTGAESTDAQKLSSFDSDGFTVGTNGDANNSAGTFASWNWLGANGTSANTDGSISSTVSANTTSGFSVVSYTGTGSAATIGHGLGSTPKMVIVKRRNNVDGWQVYVDGLSSVNHYLRLDTEAAEASDSSRFGAAPTASVFSVGTANGTNASGDTYIAYCFADVQGYSKFGSYTGNGSAANSPFVYTGFKPAFILFKKTAAEKWLLMDNKRNTFNVSTIGAIPDSNQAEENNSLFNMDFLSNGFKPYTSWNGINASGGTYIYMAFAEEPLVGDNPATAR